MTHPSNSSDIEAIYQLLTTYSFDAEDYQIEAVITGWLTEFGSVWVSHAITEALYQGRYKLISIDQILKLWQRRGQPIRHFNREFESIILGQTLLYPTGYGDGPEPSPPRSAPPPASATPTPQPLLDLPDLEPAPMWAEFAEADRSGADAEGPEESAAQSVSNAEAPEPAAETEDAIAAESTPYQARENPFESHTSAQRTPAPAAETPQAIPNFRPLPAEPPAPCQQVDVIQPFVPRRDESDLHERLRAVVQGGMRE
ncbi:hypothetical protein [Nodosilinea nodulosa]|uniref:hypothetical protein n=1 Tax=Nodosilinea nodulosa TaxID=416001 RepID=UPI00031A4F68|nr:hypothetical protein [Nodosilinea nodulosa]